MQVHGLFRDLGMHEHRAVHEMALAECMQLHGAQSLCCMYAHVAGMGSCAAFAVQAYIVVHYVRIAYFRFESLSH